MSYVPGYIPVIPLRNTVLFPETSMPIRVGRERSVVALQSALKESSWVILAAQKNPHQNVEKPEDIHSVGVLCKIESFKLEEDGSYNIFVKAHQRVRTVEIKDRGDFFEALSEPLNDQIQIDRKTQDAFLASIKAISFEVLDLLPGNHRQIKEWISTIQDLNLLTNVCAVHADLALADKQALLENIDLKNRSLKLLDLLQDLKERLKVQIEIRQKLNESIQQNQKENILREQMKVIKEELGENDKDDIVSKYKKKIEALTLPAEALELAQSQLKRLEGLQSHSPEYQMVRSHLDLFVSLPWNQSSTHSDIDLEAAEKVLNQDHYGIDKVKKRILQHLAVMKLKNSTQGSIMLLLGPPGVGKTSLGVSIAKALGKKYTRVSLGGIRDDAEIRGHRRTYIGAMPGRILAALKKAGENDPVFILDEIDKLSRSFGGDPASALLEVLDPEQNMHFHDHYLDTGFDLSKVFFIATANSLEGIPGPLLDRMEVIELSGYTRAEKKHIATEHLWQKQLKEHGLENYKIQLSEEALEKLLSHYTREAGVRDLQRKIAQILQSISIKLLKSPEAEYIVTADELEEIFGAERFSSDMIEAVLPPGVVTGLAWTPVGGDILFIETAQMPGTSQLILTGQLGEVMQESAKIALTLLKSNLSQLDPLIDFSKKDIHVHVPAGAIPKDGPSAGVTMLTSIASMLLKKSVDPKLAMTGEISLRGSVLPVGGIKEKLIAAHRAGVREIILSKKNQKDLREVPEEVKQAIRFHFVDNITEVLKIALGLNIPNEMSTDVMAIGYKEGSPTGITPIVES